MKLHVLAFKNVIIRSFTTPNFIDINPEDAAVQLERSIALNIKDNYDKVKPYENLVLFHIAEFDDQTGIITPLQEPVMLLNCADAVAYQKSILRVINEKENDTDGKSSIN